MQPKLSSSADILQKNKLEGFLFIKLVLMIFSHDQVLDKYKSE